jgi:hypothetical protein
VRAVEALIAREDATATTGLRIIDPLLAAWVNEGRHGV